MKSQNFGTNAATSPVHHPLVQQSQQHQQQLNQEGPSHLQTQLQQRQLQQSGQNEFVGDNTSYYSKNEYQSPYVPSGNAQMIIAPPSPHPIPSPTQTQHPITVPTQTPPPASMGFVSFVNTGDATKAMQTLDGKHVQEATQEPETKMTM